MLTWLGTATIKSTQARKPTFGFQVSSRLEPFREPRRWEGWDLTGKVLMGLDEMKTAFCQHVCPQIHYLDMRALLCNVRRKEPANPYHDSLISILSLIVLRVPWVQLIEKRNFHQLKYQRIGAGYYPECGQTKGKGIFTEHAISPQQAINAFSLDMAEPVDDKPG